MVWVYTPLPVRCTLHTVGASYREEYAYSNGLWQTKDSRGLSFAKFQLPDEILVSRAFWLGSCLAQLKCFGTAF